MDAEYKDMNESAPIPSLTLEPELESWSWPRKRSCSRPRLPSRC